MTEQVLDQNTVPATPAEPITETNVLGNLVGDGKKYKTDEALVEGVQHKDAHISKLETETSELRAELAKRTSVEEVLSQLKAQHTPTENTTPSVNVEELVRQTIANESAATAATANITASNALLVAAYGDKASETVVAKAATLGVTVDSLQDIAAKSPEMFKNVMGISSEPLASTPVPAVGIRTEGQQPASTDHKAYYRDMRKTNPNKYHSMEECNARYELIAAGKL